MAGRVESLRFKEICHQLLLPDDIANIIVKKSLESNNPCVTFNEAIHQEKRIELIINASTNYRNRLYKYLEKEIHLEKGDTLIFVDLGYTGTTQIRLAPVFKDELDVDIVGCYLISLQTSHDGFKKSGLLSSVDYDDKSLAMLVTYIAILEQICTSTDKSVIDFDDNGCPIYADIAIDSEQAQKIKSIQSESIRFITDATKFIQSGSFNLCDKDYQDLAAINLMRLIYFPSKLENEFFATIKHDVNMGTDDITPLLNTELGFNNLKHRGWLHCLKELSFQSRMNYPAEWRAIALDLSIVLMAQHRFDFKIATNDLSQRDILVSILLQVQNDSSLLSLPASPTYAGYYSLIVPIPKNGRIGILFGEQFKCLELDAIDRIDLDYLYTKSEQIYSHDVANEVILNKIMMTHGRIMDIQSNESLLIYTPMNQSTNNEVLRIIFRPLVSN